MRLHGTIALVFNGACDPPHTRSGSDSGGARTVTSLPDFLLLRTLSDPALRPEIWRGRCCVSADVELLGRATSSASPLALDRGEPSALALVFVLAVVLSQRFLLLTFTRSDFLILSYVAFLLIRLGLAS